MSREVRKLFAEKLKNIRLKENLSQERFAEKCGVDRTYIGRLERLERSPSLDILYKISQNLGMKLEDLLNFSE